MSILKLLLLVCAIVSAAVNSKAQGDDIENSVERCRSSYVFCLADANANTYFDTKRLLSDAGLLNAIVIGWKEGERPWRVQGYVSDSYSKENRCRTASIAVEVSANYALFICVGLYDSGAVEATVIYRQGGINRELFSVSEKQENMKRVFSSDNSLQNRLLFPNGLNVLFRGIFMQVSFICLPSGLCMNIPEH